MSETTGQRLKRLRLAQGMTQDQLAEAIGANRVTIAKYEKDAYMPSSDALLRIANVFKTSTDYVLGKETRREENDDVWDLRESLRRDPERRLLFDAARNVSKEDILTAVRILDALRGTSKNGTD